MTILITIVSIIIGLVLILLIAALFVKKDYTISSEVVINSPANNVFDYIKYLKNQNNYSKWVMADPNSRKQYKGVDGTVGFSFAWDSDNKNVGKGEQQITKINEGKNVDVQINFEKPFENVAFTKMTTNAIGLDQTKVIWEMSGVNKYPMNIMNPFIGKLLGKDMETSLNNLKAILEK